MNMPAIKSIILYTSAKRGFDEEEPTDMYNAYLRAAEDCIRNSNKFHSDLCKWKKKKQK